MRRAASLLPLLASACSMEPAYVRPDPAIPASWPVGDPYLAQAEVGLPILTYQQVFMDPRLQTLIGEALVNNRDLMIAASNIAAAREQYRIQRAALLPTVQAGASGTVSQTDSDAVKGTYQAGASVPKASNARPVGAATRASVLIVPPKPPRVSFRIAWFWLSPI